MVIPTYALMLLGTGLCFLNPGTASNQQLRLGLIAMLIYLFTCFYSSAEGPIPFAYSAEVFPLSVRGVGMAWAVAVGYFFSGILSICWPTQLQVFTPTGAFGSFVGLNVLSFCLIFLFVCETAHLTLEGIDQVFAVPQRVYIGHLFRHVVPYYFLRYVCWRRSATLKPLVYLNQESPDPDDHNLSAQEKGWRCWWQPQSMNHLQTIMNPWLLASGPYHMPSL